MLKFIFLNLYNLQRTPLHKYFKPSGKSISLKLIQFLKHSEPTLYFFR